MIIIFNKPYGVISQFSEHNTYDSLKDFIPIKNVYPAGRLDADSEGLVILTDNGQFQNRLSSPTSNIEKIYLAQVENIPKMEEIMRLEKGIQISSYVTKKSKVKLIEEPQLWERKPPIRKRKFIPTSWLEIKISEGKNRQVRKMTAAIGCPTLRLIRTGVGDYSLGNLQPGQYKIVE
ncbi:MAG: pseudouridine synthase [Methylophilaceae bacterium]